MCGISGFIHHDRTRPADKSMAAAMASTMPHRGPDDEGVFVDGACGFGFRRLSIIDLEGGRQPVPNEDETIWVQLNGEIYNYKALRSELEGHGHRFRTESDTETIVHGYEQWGDAIVDHLNGMFGFAIWDSVRQRLLVARDHLGIKPVYFHDDGQTVRFGSEMRAVLAHDRVPRRLDHDAVRLFLHFGYVPAPLTILDGVHKLRPGHLMTVEPGIGLRIRRFWNSDVVHRDIESDDAADEYAEVFTEAVKRQMVSDVPVGCLLSGGVDSAMVLAAMRDHANGPVSTFTIGFEENFDHDEADDAAATAALFGADHHRISVSSADFDRSFDLTIDHLEEPVLSQSTFAYTLLNQHVRDHVKVVLTGQGADEPWAGYDRYLGERYGTHARWLFGSSAVDSLAGRIPGANRFRRATAALGIADPVDRFAAIHQVFSADFVNDHGNGAMRSASATAQDAIRYWQRDVDHLDEFSQLLYVDTRMSLPDDLLLYGDKLSMASSIEARVPILDREVVDFVEALPPQHKLHRRTHKAVHKKAAQRMLPDEIVHRRKRGFATPVDRWFAGELEPTLRRVVLGEGSVCTELLSRDALSTLLDEHRDGQRNHRRQLTALLSLELSAQRLLDPSSAASLSGTATQKDQQ